MPNATLFLSREVDGFKLNVQDVNLYRRENGQPYAALDVEERIDRPGCYVTMAHTTIHADRAADLDKLIAGLMKMRGMLADAEMTADLHAAKAAAAVPLAEALKDPAGFVAGMTETRATHRKVWLILSTGTGGKNGSYWSRSANGGNGGWSERPEEYARFDSFADAKRVALAERFRPGKYEITEAVETTPEAEAPDPKKYALAGALRINADDPADHSDSGDVG